MAKRVVFHGHNLLGIAAMMARRGGVLFEHDTMGDAAAAVPGIEKSLQVRRDDLHAIELVHGKQPADRDASEYVCVPPLQDGTGKRPPQRHHSVKKLNKWIKDLPTDAKERLRATGYKYLYSRIKCGTGNAENGAVLHVSVCPKFVKQGTLAAKKLRKGQIVVKYEHPDDMLTELDWVDVDEAYVHLVSNNKRLQPAAARRRRTLKLRCKEAAALARGPPAAMPGAAAAVGDASGSSDEDDEDDDAGNAERHPVHVLVPRSKRRRTLFARV